MQTRIESSTRNGLAALCAVYAALLALAGCAPDSNEAPAAGDGGSAPAARYVGGDVCAGCHADEARAWQGSHHDLAMQPATEESVLGDFGDVRFEHGGVTTVFTRRDGEYIVRTDGPDGAIADFTITHTFGVEPLQQYLARLPGGRLQALSIAWDSRPADAGGQRWFHLYADGDDIGADDSAPDADGRSDSGDDHVAAAIGHEDPLHWTGTAMSWNTSCAACHSTGLVKGYSLETQTFATTWAGIDVDCEACHGPGSLHAAEPERESAHLPRDQRAWAFVPNDPIAKRQPPAPADHAEVETCAQCHSRRAQIRDAFAADDALLDDFVPALLDEDLYHADGQILGEVFEYGSFVQSAMYAAGVTCSDCHDPHSARLRAEGNALCAGCHAANVYDVQSHHRHAPGGPGAECVACHMRQETYMSVDPRRDHSFRVPRPDLSVTAGTPNACGDCHADRGAEWAAEKVAEWYPGGRSGDFHYGQAIHAGRAWTADRVPLLTRVFEAEDERLPDIARATAVRLLSEHLDAAALRVLERALDDADERVQLAALESLDGVPAAARIGMAQRFLTHPRRALRITAAAALAGSRDGLSERRRADLDAALDEYMAAQTFNGDRAEGFFNRANVLAAAGRPRDAEAALAAAIEREPAFAPAYVNLAELQRLAGLEDDARNTLTRGLGVNPDDAALRYALGLSLVRGGRRDEALNELRRAAEAGADEPRYSYAYGVALLSADPDRALDVLGDAARRFPGHPPTLFALAALHRDLGNTRAALDYTERLLDVSPSDPDGRALRAQLEAGGAEAR